MRTRGRGAVHLVLCMLLAMPLAAHEDIEIQIAEITRRMSGDPENTILLLRRGELHRHHRDWLAALSDFRRALEIDPDLHIAYLSLGKLFIDTDLPGPALLALDRFLDSVPDHAQGRLTRARALFGLGRRLEAAADLARGIDLEWNQPRKRRPRPDDYLDLARALASGGGEHIDEAVRCLDDGARRLGGAIQLRLLAVDLEIGRKRWDAALERLSAIEAVSARKEKWLARRGEVLVQAGRAREAREAFEDALEAIDALPVHCRGTGALSGLEARIRNVLSALPIAEDARPARKEERT